MYMYYDMPRPRRPTSQSVFDRPRVEVDRAEDTLWSVSRSFRQLSQIGPLWMSLSSCSANVVRIASFKMRWLKVDRR